MQRFIELLWQILALCRKEFLVLFKDPANRVTLFAPALLQALLFGYGATYDLTHAPYALLDQSKSAASTELIAHLDATGVFCRVATLQSGAQTAAMIDNGRAMMVISIPADFAQKLATGQNASLQVILDGRNSSTAGMASAYIAHIVNAFNQSHGHLSPMTLETRVWYNPNLDPRWAIMPALIAALSFLQTLLLAALSVTREREQGTFDQLLVTPLTPLQILIGKAIPSMCVGLLQSTIILLIIRFWFQVPMSGSLLVLYGGLLFFTLASVGIGLSISALASNMQQAMLYTFVMMMPMMLLSGMLTSVNNMPLLLQWGTYANPLRFGIEIVRRVYLEGAPLSDVALNFIPLFVVAIITLPYRLS